MPLAEIDICPLWLQERDSRIGTAAIKGRGRIILGPVGDWFADQGAFYEVQQRIVEKEMQVSIFHDYFQGLQPVIEYRLVCTEELALLFKMTWE